VERLLETVTTDGHQFRAQCKTNIDAAGCDLVCNILCSFETGGTESVYCRGGGCVWKASCKGSGTEFVCSFAIGDLRIGILDPDASGRLGELKRTYIATADILNEFGVEF
jgi:hypothetical protein